MDILSKIKGDMEQVNYTIWIFPYLPTSLLLPPHPPPPPNGYLRLICAFLDGKLHLINISKILTLSTEIAR